MAAIRLIIGAAMFGGVMVGGVMLGGDPAAAQTTGQGTGQAATSAFPLDRELLLDAPPMRPGKRIPGITVAADGRAAIDLWCRSVTGRIEPGVASVAVTVDVAPRDLAQQPLPAMVGPGQCSEQRVAADEALLTALMQMNAWRRDGEAVVLSGADKPLRFRPATN